MLYYVIFCVIVLCHIYYEDKSDFLTFTDSKLCANIGWYGDFVKNACIVAVIMLIDILTVIKVRRMSRKVWQQLFYFKKAKYLDLRKYNWTGAKQIVL